MLLHHHHHRTLLRGEKGSFQSQELKLILGSPQDWKLLPPSGKCILAKEQFCNSSKGKKKPNH